VRQQHLLDVLDDLWQPGHIVVTQANRFINPTVRHARRIFHRNLREYRVRHIKRALVESADTRQSPTNFLDRTFDLLVRRTHPITHHERAIEIDHQPAKEIGQQILRSKTDGDTADTTKGQHAGNRKAQALQTDQHGSNQHRDAQQLANSVDGGAVNTVAARNLPFKNGFLHIANEAHEKPGQTTNHTNAAHRCYKLENCHIGFALHNTRREGEANDPGQQRKWLTGRANQRRIPRVVGACGT